MDCTGLVSDRTNLEKQLRKVARHVREQHRIFIYLRCYSLQLRWSTTRSSVVLSRMIFTTYIDTIIVHATYIGLNPERSLHKVYRISLKHLSAHLVCNFV